MERNLREFKKIDTGNPLRDLFFNYYLKIDDLRDSEDREELQKTLDIIIGLLPRNVTSFCVPIYREEETVLVRSKRESMVPEEEQIEWNPMDLLDFSMSIDQQGNYDSVD